MRIEPRTRAPRVALAAMLAAAAIGAGAAAPARAADYPGRTVAGWTVAASRDGQGCFLTRGFAMNGGTQLLLGLNADGTSQLTLLNANWSIAPREALTLTYRLSRAAYADHRAIGLHADGKRGFVAAFDRAFPERFAAARTLAVTRGTVPVAALDLAGSGAAVAEMRRCVAAQRNRSAADPAAESSTEIPRDPFAK